jgi:hypothetical protein
MTDARRAQEERVRLSNYGGSTTFDVSFEQTSIYEGSAGTRKDSHDGSPAEVERMQDPRMFYASDSPVFYGSDSDQEVYESAEETLEPEGQADEQVDGNSVGLHVSFASSWLVSVSTKSSSCLCNSLRHPSHSKGYLHSTRHYAHNLPSHNCLGKCRLRGHKSINHRFSEISLE